MAKSSSKQTRPPIDWDEALRLREAEKRTFADIAREFGYSPHTVRNKLLALGAHGREKARQGPIARKLRAIWRFTHEKCEKPSHPSYARNGGEGATVSGEWATFEPFYEWARGAGYRIGLRLALKSEFDPYAPWNCQWLTPERIVARRKMPQGRTRRGQKSHPIDWERAKRLFLDDGLSMPEVAREIGASYTGVYFGFRRMGIRRPKLPSPTSTPEGLRLRKTWDSMHKRCTDPTNALFPYHGARGACVSEEWSTFAPFLAWALGSGSKPGLCLLRVDRSKPYGPRNCVWGTRQQAALRKRPPSHPPAARRPLTVLGETKSMAAWARDPRCSVSVSTIGERLGKGWSAARAITEPRDNRGSVDRVVVELRAFGQTKSIADWIRDKRCHVTTTGLNHRLRRGWSTEDAISTPPFQQPNSEQKATRSRPRG